MLKIKMGRIRRAENGIGSREHRIAAIIGQKIVNW